jgi:hypothetical protein
MSNDGVVKPEARLARAIVARQARGDEVRFERKLERRHCERSEDSMGGG